MLNVGDLFQWERFITPSIIKIFYWLAVILTLLFGISGLLAAVGTMMTNPVTGLVMVIADLLGMLIGIVFARIAAEIVLILFRINEHLGALRKAAGM